MLVARSNPFLRELARTTVRWATLLVGVLIALEILDATALVGAVLGTAGVLGVALGFAFKDILENYLAGILMSVRQMFAPKDHLVIDGNEGIVVALTSRATILMTLDGNHLRIPNALVFRSVTLNYTRNPVRRFEFDVGVGVNEDLVAAQATGMDMPEPIYRVQLTERAVEPAKPARAPATVVERVASDAAAIDTRVNADLSTQVDRDRHARGSEDLLDADAPRE